MARIKPFKAVFYNQRQITDLSSVTCPPYDVVSAQEQRYYHDKSPYNFLHILLGKDVEGEDKYQRCADYFKDWLKDKILVSDDKSGIYFYAQEYHIRGQRRERLGFIALLRLGDDNSPVFGHENTHIGPKEDRLKLLKRVKANLSPIFAVFADKKKVIQRIYGGRIKEADAFITVADKERTRHRVWRLDSADDIEAIQSAMGTENIFIADGHHRYEVACAFREEMKNKLGGAYTGNEDFNYILAYFTNTDPRGLMILPIHRLVSMDESVDKDGFLSGIKEYFDISRVKDEARFFFLLEKGGRSEHVIGMFSDRGFELLRLKNIRTPDKAMPDKPKEYRFLDVSILNSLILKKATDDPEHGKQITFSPDAADFVRQVRADARKAAFFLNPVKIEQVMALALKGERMPPKSTYFYPKVLSGLVINKLEG